jgi:hypothetical protein
MPTPRLDALLLAEAEAHVVRAEEAMAQALDRFAMAQKVTREARERLEEIQRSLLWRRA